MDCYLQNHTVVCSPHTCQSLAAKPHAWPRPGLESCCGSRWLVAPKSSALVPKYSAPWVLTYNTTSQLSEGEPQAIWYRSGGKRSIWHGTLALSPASKVCVGKWSCLRSGRGGGGPEICLGEAACRHSLNSGQETTLSPGDKVGFLPQFLLRIANSI